MNQLRTTRICSHGAPSPCSQSRRERVEWLQYTRKMRFQILAYCCIGLFAATAQAQTDSKIISEIRAVLEAQQQAWNRGDIDGFMSGYDRSESTAFVSEDKITRGWQAVRH